ncbi:MAG: RdgB/HAM1 family non-canonical purine NTP pyrophosphatase [Polyangiaceae bacterium]|nr:RdgB/HAM1 family non-canonical purine NTP pyrophosphatase [Polyangiaceae bacterium]
MERLLFATSNPHKIREVRAILEPAGFVVEGLDARATVEEPVEDADTFEGNARLKALCYARALGERCLAEDSGLEVDALDGAPGVFSARYAGLEGGRDERDHANNLKLLAALEGVPTAARTARFVCAVCVADPDGTIVAEARGTYEGMIAEAPKGSNGFGYDPLLYLPDVGRTSAELSPADKNARSHRNAAVRELLGRLRGLEGGVRAAR